MRKIVSQVRRCVEDYDMIQPGDRLAVGVSGGKDSLALLAALAELRRFFPRPFTMEAITLDLGIPGMSFEGVADFCRAIEVPYTIIPTQINHIIFNVRKEKNPCSMCAKMRRGALNEALLSKGLRKIALGHHFDDAVETFFLSLFFESRISCFQPVTDLDRTGVLQIRPLLYCTEAQITSAAQRLCFPVVHNPCPADGVTKRQEVKELIAQLEKQYPHLREKVFSAMQRLPLKSWETKNNC